MANGKENGAAAPGDHYEVKDKGFAPFDKVFRRMNAKPVQYVLAFNSEGECLLFTKKGVEVNDQRLDRGELASSIANTLFMREGVGLSNEEVNNIRDARSIADLASVTAIEIESILKQHEPAAARADKQVITFQLSRGSDRHDMKFTCKKPGGDSPCGRHIVDIP